MTQIPSNNKKIVRKKIEPYDYIRQGKVVKVTKSFKRRYYKNYAQRKKVRRVHQQPRPKKPQPKRLPIKKQPIKKTLKKERASEKIELDEAKAIFAKRPDRSRIPDLKHNSKLMFSVPNKLWADAPNKFDIWGLDGFDAPTVNELPVRGLPFQIVKYQNEIYEANASGFFTTPDIKVVDLDPEDSKNQKQFELENPTKEPFQDNGETTDEYENWLTKNAKLEDIASKLNYTISKNKLYKIRELYNSLKLSEEEQRELMLKVYNKIYENKIKSYTKGFNEFYEHRFDDNLDRKIRSEENRLKEINKDPAKTKKAQEQYKTSELRMYNLVSMLESKGYYGYDTNSLREKMIELKNGENDEIVTDFINTTLKDEYGNDSDMLYIDDKRIKDDYDKIREHYEQKSYDEYVEYLEQEQLNMR